MKWIDKIKIYNKNYKEYKEYKRIKITKILPIKYIYNKIKILIHTNKTTLKYITKYK